MTQSLDTEFLMEVRASIGAPEIVGESDAGTNSGCRDS